MLALFNSILLINRKCDINKYSYTGPRITIINHIFSGFTDYIWLCIYEIDISIFKNPYISLVNNVYCHEECQFGMGYSDITGLTNNYNAIKNLIFTGQIEKKIFFLLENVKSRFCIGDSHQNFFGWKYRVL